MSRYIRLGINIDHVATLRQARKETFPDPVEAAMLAIEGGADGIVAHLREDRRHIQDNDIKAIRKAVKRFDLEMAATPEMQKMALDIKPNIVTLVPEKRQEVTTEGGLDIAADVKKYKTFIEKLQKENIIVSLFIEPDDNQIKAAKDTGAKYIELHTGAYAIAKEAKRAEELAKLADRAKLAKSLGLGINAGHGIDYRNVIDLIDILEIEELNIGFSIIARAIMVGMREAVVEMRELL
ncbi:MAG: pyridoxine 5'-phosphate synthase [bacterium]